MGHYLAAVAERLLADGLSVSSLHAHAAYSEGEIDDNDIEGSIQFNKDFQAGLNESAESFLHWTGTSGWCYRTIRDMTGTDSSSEHARWLAAGLLPTPGRVAAFVSAVRVDPDAAGSDERPSYRSPCDQSHELAARLKSYAPGAEHTPFAHIGYEYRFAEAQGTAYRDRVLEALASGDDRLLFLPIRHCELHALRHLLDYAETIAPLTGPRDLARMLAQDLTRRTPGDHRSVHQHCQARSLAAQQGDGQTEASP
ncbi:hypothetical protein AB5J52_49105 (plasmid) [Streptomyces sp. R39]|uniref:Uncharacterized protein n=1 Tax=Streptomyces sp. R39 TaxID=3238631 RepID=A0AB39RAR6_9ACTN